MQYILSENELHKLTSERDELRLRPTRDAVAAMREMIVGSKCIHAADFKGSYGYCDLCPLSEATTLLIGNPPRLVIDNIVEPMIVSTARVREHSQTKQ